MCFLHLKTPKHFRVKRGASVLECYDVAIFQGKSPTASQITFFDGTPDKKSYRHYHLQELDEGNNDFAMMHEVASRRVKKGKLPDVFIIDGGKGQVRHFLKGLGCRCADSRLGIAKSKTKSSFKQKDVVQRKKDLLYLEGRTLTFYQKVVLFIV